MPPANDGGSAAPIDRPILEFLRDRLASTEQVDGAALTDEYGRLELRVTLDRSYYPVSTTDATLTVRWYENDDFAIHYRDVVTGGRDDHDDRRDHSTRDSSVTWECRWDRHPNPHNERDHFHPPPDAAASAEDAAWPGDHRDVLGLVLDDVDQRVRTLWDR